MEEVEVEKVNTSSSEGWVLCVLAQGLNIMFAGCRFWPLLNGKTGNNGNVRNAGNTGTPSALAANSEVKSSRTGK